MALLSKSCMSLWTMLLSSVTSMAIVSAQVQYQCDPCIERERTDIHAIVHGSSDDVFWLQVQAAMEQAARDMKVTFGMTFSGDSKDGAMYDEMASAIKDAAKSSQALIVTIPDDPDGNVQAAAQAAVESGTPVFGMERGYDSAQSLGLSSFIGMDDSLAGKTAAGQMDKIASEQSKTVSDILFLHLNHAIDSNIHVNRLAGFEKGVAEGNTTNSASVETLEVSNLDDLTNTFDDCPYQGVMVGSDSEELVDKVLSVLGDKGCGFVIVGAFGTSVSIHQAVSAGKLGFTVSQQGNLQGAMSVVHAALLVTTGKSLAPSSESSSGMLLSGPEILSADNALTDTFQVCEAEGFPVCPNDKGLDGVTPSKCTCTNRPKVKIAGVLHAVTTDAFWDIVYTAANQAADDFGVALELDRMEPDEPDILHFRMAQQIENLCQQGIDGIFVTIPSEAVLEAIELCQKLNVPVVSINAGPDFSRDLRLQHHLGMVEFNAGYLAGQRMLQSDATITKGMCLDHAPGNIVLIDRCGGFKKAMDEAGVAYLGQVVVPDDNAELYVSNVESFIQENNNDDWSEIAVLLGGTPQHEPGLMLKEKHPEISVVGTFDTSDVLYQGLEDGKIVFGMDQGPYLQGYLPIPLLVWQAQTMQNTVNHLIETGPDFVSESPSEEKMLCEANHFKTCEFEEVSTTSGRDVGDSKPSTEKDNKAAIISLSIIAVLCVLGIGFLAYRMNLLKKYIHRLEEEGRSPPQLSARDYVTSAYMSADKILSQKKFDTEVSEKEEEAKDVSDTSAQPC